VPPPCLASFVDLGGGGGLNNFLAELASNCDPPDFHPSKLLGLESQATIPNTYFSNV
jgi:hypothetical protein